MNLKPNEIKDVLSMQALLESYGIQLRQKGNSLVGCCPIHQGDNPNAFHVNLQRNLWHCFTREHGGDVFNFIMEFERVDFQGALEIAQALIKNAPSRRARSPTFVGYEPRENKPLEFTLPLDPNHPYLKERRLNEATIRHFGLGYCAQGILKGRIAIPIHDAQGNLVAYSGRSLNGEVPKYKFPKGFRKSQVLFNRHRVKEFETTTLILVEGFFSVFRLHQAGFPNTVALMGSSLSQAQAGLLLALNRTLVICLDGDQAGRTGTKKIIQALRGKLTLLPRCLPEGTQPDQLDRETLFKILGRR